MQLLNGLRNEIAAVDEMEKRYEQLCSIIHTEYYKLMRSDNRAIDRTRPDYPAYLLVGVLKKEQWV